MNTTAICCARLENNLLKSFGQAFNNFCDQIGPDPSRPAALVEAPPKEHEKKKPPSKKDKTKGRSSKSKASASQATEFPGAVPGVEVNSSALWLAAEVGPIFYPLHSD